MITSDYKCTNVNCRTVFEYDKVDNLDSFPDAIKCETCGEEAKRVWGFARLSVSQGKLGNSANGFTSGCVNHPASIGKFRGTKVGK